VVDSPQVLRVHRCRLILAVLFCVDGLYGQTKDRWLLVACGGIGVVADLVLLGAVARKQGWSWFLERDNSTTKSQTP
jgi:hypothetical protein